MAVTFLLPSEAEIDAMFTAIEKSLGPVAVIVANATPVQPLKPIEEYDWAFHQQTIAVNGGRTCW